MRSTVHLAIDSGASRWSLGLLDTPGGDLFQSLNPLEPGSWISSQILATETYQLLVDRIDHFMVGGFESSDQDPNRSDMLESRLKPQ